KTALKMPLEERQSRYRSLLQGLQKDNLQIWQQSFLDDLYNESSSQISSMEPANVQMSDS
ncbi:hypothetical protein ACTXGQ_28455, partial [Marinobacter sp. 1Y8]